VRQKEKMMANEALDDDFEVEEDLAQEVSAEQEQEEVSDTPEESSNEDVVISIDGEEENEEEQERKQAPEWVRNLRKEHREAVKRTRALEAELEQLRNPVRMNFQRSQLLKDSTMIQIDMRKRWPHGLSVNESLTTNRRKRKRLRKRLSKHGMRRLLSTIRPRKSLMQRMLFLCQ